VCSQASTWAGLGDLGAGKNNNPCKEGAVPELRFKGGTSLSKVDRFSEDIDISIDRAALGFSDDRDLANPHLSNTKRKALGQELSAAITAEVTSQVLPKGWL